ncbi:MAG: hypothetical protein PGMFKBFP_02347 [Anaerolineales bacterium]|nr:hypothetical protein [Anaerolineales bacterium]
MKGRTLKVMSASRRFMSSMTRMMRSRVKMSRVMASSAQVRKSRRVSTSLITRVMTRPTE